MVLTEKVKGTGMDLSILDKSNKDGLRRVFQTIFRDPRNKKITIFCPGGNSVRIFFSAVVESLSELKKDGENEKIEKIWFVTADERCNYRDGIVPWFVDGKGNRDSNFGGSIHGGLFVPLTGRSLVDSSYRGEQVVSPDQFLMFDPGSGSGPMEKKVKDYYHKVMNTLRESTGIALVGVGDDAHFYGLFGEMSRPGVRSIDIEEEDPYTHFKGAPKLPSIGRMTLTQMGVLENVQAAFVAVNHQEVVDVMFDERKGYHYAPVKIFLSPEFFMRRRLQTCVVTNCAVPKLR